MGKSPSLFIFVMIFSFRSLAVGAYCDDALENLNRVFTLSQQDFQKHERVFQNLLDSQQVTPEGLEASLFMKGHSRKTGKMLRLLMVTKPDRLVIPATDALEQFSAYLTPSLPDGQLRSLSGAVNYGDYNFFVIDDNGARNFVETNNQIVDLPGGVVLKRVDGPYGIGPHVPYPRFFSAWEYGPNIARAFSDPFFEKFGNQIQGYIEAGVLSHSMLNRAQLTSGTILRTGETLYQLRFNPGVVGFEDRFQRLHLPGTTSKDSLKLWNDDKVIYFSERSEANGLGGFLGRIGQKIAPAPRNNDVWLLPDGSAYKYDEHGQWNEESSP